MEADKKYRLVVDKRGYIRVELPNGEYLQELDLKIENNVSGNPKECTVTITLICEHDFKNND